MIIISGILIVLLMLAGCQWAIGVRRKKVPKGMIFFMYDREGHHAGAITGPRTIWYWSGSTPRTKLISRHEYTDTRRFDGLIYNMTWKETVGGFISLSEKSGSSFLDVLWINVKAVIAKNDPKNALSSEELYKVARKIEEQLSHKIEGVELVIVTITKTISSDIPTRITFVRVDEPQEAESQSS